MSAPGVRAPGIGPALRSARLPLAATFGLGAVAATGQAPWGFWWLALAAHAALALAVARAPSARAAGWRAWAAGVGHFGLALSWIVEPFLIDAPRHGWMAPFALVLLAGGLALFWGAAGWAAGQLHGRAARALGFAATLAAAEATRGLVLTGFPWALPGHVWIDTPVAQAAALGGAAGLTLATLAAAGLAAAWPRAGTAAAAAVLAGLWLWGGARLAEPPPERTDAPVLRLVQPLAEQHLKWDAGLARSHFDRLVDLSLAPSAAAGRDWPDLVIWPETAVPYVFGDSPALAEAIAAAGAGSPVAAGVQRTDGTGETYWNSLVVLGAGGAVLATYDKHHLVPFGEYVPAGDLLHRLFGIAAFAAQAGHGYSAGPGPAVLDLGPRLGRALPLICYEAVFPAALRVPDPRADWILQITNDAWFGTLTGPYQHLAQARLRAVEQGLPLVRVANTGISAVIDAHGRVLAAMPLGQRGQLDAALPPSLPATPYATAGDGPVWALTAGLFLAALGLSRRRMSGA